MYMENINKKQSNVPSIVGIIFIISFIIIVFLLFSIIVTNLDLSPLLKLL
jgi:hypothetical protein